MSREHDHGPNHNHRPPNPGEGEKPDHHHHHHHHHHGPHDHGPYHSAQAGPGGRILVIRPNSGISGDILVAGLSALADIDQAEMDAMLEALNLAQLKGRVSLINKEVSEVGGVGLKADLPSEHEHRDLSDIEKFFDQTSIDQKAKDLAKKCFRILAEAEGAVHGRPAEEVHFHEVGALDSIMDIGLVSVLIDKLKPARIVSGPLPICDGVINCQHGLLPSPAPAVLRLLTGVPVVGLTSRGETVTPTGLTLLLAMGAEFGPWPPLVPERQTLAYGSRLLPGVPNGAVFVLGREHGLGR